MKQRLERALEVAMKTMVELAEGVFPENLLDSRLAEIDAILHPVEVEEIPLVQWAIVAPSGYVECVYSSKGSALARVEDENCPFFNYSVAELRGTLRREKKVVERSVRMTIDSGGWRVEGHHEGFGGRGPITGTFEWT